MGIIVVYPKLILRKEFLLKVRFAGLKIADMYHGFGMMYSSRSSPRMGAIPDVPVAMYDEVEPMSVSYSAVNSVTMEAPSTTPEARTYFPETWLWSLLNMYGNILITSSCDWQRNS